MKQSTLTLVKLFDKGVKNVKLQDFDDYSNAAHEEKMAFISTGVRGMQIVDKLFSIFFRAFIQFNCGYDHNKNRFQCPCDGRSFGGMPEM